MTTADTNNPKKRVGFFLGLGILLFPFLFPWFTLRKGHSLRSRVLSFSWLTIVVVMYGLGVSTGENSKSAKVAQTHETQELPKTVLQSKRKAESIGKTSSENTVESSLPPFDTMEKQRGNWPEATPPMAVPDSLRKLSRKLGKLFKNSNIVIFYSRTHARLLPLEIVKLIKENYNPWAHASSHIRALLRESKKSGVSKENEPQELRLFRERALAYLRIIGGPGSDEKHVFNAFKGYHNPIFPSEYVYVSVYEYQKNGERRHFLRGAKKVKFKNEFDGYGSGYTYDVLGDSLLSDPIYEGKTIDELVREAIEIISKTDKQWLKLKDGLEGFMLAKCGLRVKNEGRLRKLSRLSIEPSSMFIHPDLRTIAVVFRYMGRKNLSFRSKLKIEFKKLKTKESYTGYYPILDKVGPQVAFVKINDKAFVEMLLNRSFGVSAKIGLVN